MRTLLSTLLALTLLGRWVPSPWVPKTLVAKQADGPTPSLHLQWVRQMPRQQPAWPDQTSLQFDRTSAPTLMGQLAFLNSSQTDSILAVDLKTGEEKWRFVTEGPVRFAPAVWNDRLFVGSDDGYLYCLQARDGALLWKKRGGPSEQKILGNGRLISMWPIRVAPVVVEAKQGKDSRTTVYFAAGIWPFMGVFLHAVDAGTGESIWTNDGDGSQYLTQPHRADSFAGVAPQGRLDVIGDKLIVPGGRSVPAVYDRHTGRMLHYRLSDNSKKGGGWYVQGSGKAYINGSAIFDLETGDALMSSKGPAWLTPTQLHVCSGSTCTEYDLRDAGPHRVEIKTKRGKTVKAVWKPKKTSETRIPRAKVLGRDGNTLYFADGNALYSLLVPFRAEQAPLREANLEGEPVHLLARAGRVLVSTEDGKVYCFGPQQVKPRSYALPELPGPADAKAGTLAQDLLKPTSIREGYALLFGIDSPSLLSELVRRSSLRFVVLEPDAKKAARAREALRHAQIPAERVAVLLGDARSVALPPYLASLVLCPDVERAGLALEAPAIRSLYRTLRPYGGTAYLRLAAEQRKELTELVTNDKEMPQARIREVEDGLLLSKEGAIPGSADWTHEHADASNTRVSKDQIVKAPLGLLWFGGTSHKGVLPRHGHGPQPQVVQGCAIQEGVDGMRAIDIYTGRLLWETPLPGVGKVFDYTGHQPGANGTGTNFVSTPEGVYVAYGRACVRLDLATGKIAQRLELPKLDGESESPQWAYLNVIGDYLIGGANLEKDLPKKKTIYIASSDFLFVLDRKTGKPLWQARSRHGGFRHNAVCAGGERLYAIDRPASRYSAWPRKKGKPSGEAEVVAFDLKTGEKVWQYREKVFGTWLSYSAEHDVLVEAGRVARDSLPDEPKGMRAYRADDGKVLWYDSGYSGPAMLLGDRILQGHGACELLTGKPILRPDPITGKLVEWSWARNYGCNTPAASQHLLTFRSGAAGYYDLCNEGGTGNFGGFRSGCTNNLIVAGGVLTAPDYTRTCTCSYQNQTSLALVPMPEAEMWTFQGGSSKINDTVRQLGILLGAPGNRKADNGTLWLCYPAVRGPGPRPPVTIEPEKPEWFRFHSSGVAGENSWIGSAGAKGIRSLTLVLSGKEEKERPYRVRLVFVEPEPLGPGQRKFDVTLQGKLVRKGFDVVEKAGGPKRLLVEEFRKVMVGKELRIELSASSSSKGHSPILSGVEILPEGW